jgi:hypothetical protein
MCLKSFRNPLVEEPRRLRVPCAAVLAARRARFPRRKKDEKSYTSVHN